MTIRYLDSSRGPLAVVACETIKNLAKAAFTAAQTKTVWTPAAGKSAHLFGLSLTAGGATTLTVRYGASILFERDFSAAGSVDFNMPQNGILLPKDAALTVTSSAAVSAGATAVGCEV